MHGARRVVIFCLLTAVLPTILLIIPLYLRHNLFADVVYPLTESDIVEISDGISTVFCQEHTLKMNTTFNAYQVESEPEIGSIRKHIRLKKSMSLPDDTLEYWGFFLPKGSIVVLTGCSRREGAKILVVEGEKNLNTCGLLDHSKKKIFNSFARVNPPNEGQVRVTFETVAQEMLSNETESLLSQFLKENKTSLFRKSRSVSKNDLDFNDAREIEDTEGMKTFMFFKEIARKYTSKYHERVNSTKLRTFEETIIGHKLRHSKQRAALKNSASKGLSLSNNHIEERIQKDQEARKRRNIVSKSPHNLDIDKIAHGGNGFNFTEDESSASSFETSLLNCYSGQIFLTESLPFSESCVNNSSIYSNKFLKITTSHEANHDGYYYYIFYSDNDDVQNDIHVNFDILKPTYEYGNFSKKCMNKTECAFPLNFYSDQRVIVEVPTRDGIEHEDDDITFLVSVCQPRMTVYIIFPILVLFLILGCAFL